MVDARAIAPPASLASIRALAATIVAAATLVAAAPTAAQTDATGPVDGPRAFLVVGAGALPEYEGADTLGTVPLLVARTRLGGAALEITGTRARLGIAQGGQLIAGPVLGVVAARDDSVDDERVARLDAVDLSFEAGVFAAWRAPFGTADEGELELGATLTSAVGGDWEGTELVFGADYSWAATPLLRLALGASTSVVDEAYAESRFGVSAEDARASGFGAFAPSSGLKDASVSLRSILSFHPRYGVFTRIAYTRLLGDAADGPLVAEAGDADQLFLGAGLFVSFGR